MFYPVKILCHCFIISSVKLQFSASFSFTQVEYNIIASGPMKLVCNVETNITNSVTIRSPDSVVVVLCQPSSTLPPIAASCSSSGVYTGVIDETAKTVTVTTNNLPGDVNGTWSCTHGSDFETIVFPSPIPCLISENFDVNPSSIGNVTSTTAPISLIATYSCINVDVTFKWILKAGGTSSKEFIPSSVAKDSTACTDSGTCTGVSAYTQTISSDSLFIFANYENLRGGYELSAEAVLSNGVTALKSHSIGYLEFRHDTTTVEISTATTDEQSTTVKNTPTSSSDLLTTEIKGNNAIVASASLNEISTVAVSTQTLSVNRGTTITADNLYLIPIISLSLVCLLIVTLAIVVTGLYYCGRLPIFKKSKKYIKTEKFKRQTETDNGVCHKRKTERLQQNDINTQKKMSSDKQKKHDRNANEQKVGRSIKDKREKYDTESIQFYTRRQCRNDDYLEMNERSSSKENTGITDIHKRSGFDRKLTVATSSQKNVNDRPYHGYTKYANREMLNFQEYDYKYSKRYQQDGIYYDNRRNHPNYLSDRHELANIDPYYHNDRPQTQRLYYMASNDKYWPETIDHDRQQPYSSCSSYWY